MSQWRNSRPVHRDVKIVVLSIPGEKISIKFALAPFAISPVWVAVNTFGSSTKRRMKKTRNAGNRPTQNNARQAVS
jgi:hypothetical protein